jgi:hypothetical protein
LFGLMKLGLIRLLKFRELDNNQCIRVLRWIKLLGV